MALADSTIAGFTMESLTGLSAKNLFITIFMAPSILLSRSSDEFFTFRVLKYTQKWLNCTQSKEIEE